MQEQSFGSLIRRVSGKSDLPLPSAAMLEITERCNLRCKFCYMGNSRIPAYDISIEKAFNLIDQLEKAGCMEIILTGGEPLLRKDFLKIYKYIKNKGILISIFTNGTLITQELADYFKDFPPKYVRISLYAGSNEGYKRISGCDFKAFDRIVKAAKLLKYRNINFWFRSVITKLNINEVENMKRLADDLDVYFRIRTHITENVDRNNALHQLKIDSEQRNRLKKFPELYKWVKDDERLAKYKECNGCLYISNKGELLICPVIRDKECYNLDMCNFQKLWRKRITDRVIVTCPRI